MTLRSHRRRFESRASRTTFSKSGQRTRDDVPCRRIGYLTALARTDLNGELNYTDRNVVEKLFQTYTMRIGRFHETWNGGQLSAERWLTAYTYYYNHLRGHQALNDQPPVENLEASI